jgi:nucleoside-diphosphate-sugar epimerase
VTTVVTGAAGFIGRHLVDALVAAGTDVVGIDRRPQAPRPGLRPMRADLTHAEPAVVAALAGAEAVFHLAARPGVRESGPDVERARHRDNVESTAVVAAHVPLGVPLVVTSSSSVYGGSAGVPCHEDDALRPAGGYARSKVAAEAICVERLRRGGLVAVARPFTVVGEGQRPDMALSRWIAAVSSGAPVTVYGGLYRRRDVTDVADVVRGLLVMAERRVCGPVNLGTGVGHSLGELLEHVLAALGATRAVVEHVPVPQGDVDATLAHTARCAEVLGFVPRTNLAYVVARQVAASDVCVAVPA